MLEKGANTHSHFMVFILLLIIAALGVSFYRYYFKLGYDIEVYADCDPAEAECVSDGESYYYKFSAPASVLSSSCPDGNDSECIIELYKANSATLLNCEEYLEDGEECVGPDAELLDHAE